MPSDGGLQDTREDPMTILQRTQNWSVSPLNDFFCEWAVHDANWDYRDPDGTDQDPGCRSSDGPMTDRVGGTTQAYRALRTTTLAPLPNEDRTFVTPTVWAPRDHNPKVPGSHLAPASPVYNERVGAPVCQIMQQGERASLAPDARHCKARPTRSRTGTPPNTFRTQRNAPKIARRQPRQG